MNTARRLPVYVEPEICGPCGGACCKTYPGIARPDDVGAPDRASMIPRIVSLLRSGKWAIDWWAGDGVRFLRPAMVGHEGQHRHGGWRGQCALLTPTGCSLEHDDRPFGCRLLEPNTAHGSACMPKGGPDKRAQVFAWQPYQVELEGALRALGPDMVDGGEDHAPHDPFSLMRLFL